MRWAKRAALAAVVVLSTAAWTGAPEPGTTDSCARAIAASDRLVAQASIDWTDYQGFVDAGYQAASNREAASQALAGLTAKIQAREARLALLRAEYAAARRECLHLPAAGTVRAASLHQQ